MLITGSQTASYYDINPYNSRGVDIQILYGWRVIKKSQFSLAIGGGFNSNNIHSNAFPRTYQFGGRRFLHQDGHGLFLRCGYQDQQRSLTNYIDIPFEVRWRSKRGTKIKKRWAVSVGFKGWFSGARVIPKPEPRKM